MDQNQNQSNEPRITREEAERLREHYTRQLRVLDFRRVPLSQLSADYSYQRPIVADAKIAEMARNLSGEAFGHALVGQRANGTCWIVDAQQRYAALRFGVEDVRQHFPTYDPPVPCAVFESRGPLHEASVFFLVNARRTPLKPHEVFRAAVKAGYALYVEIARHLKAIHMDVGTPNAKTPHVIGFTSVLVKTWIDNTEACRHALDLQREIVGASGVLVRAIHKGLWHVLDSKRTFAVREIAYLRRMKKDAICRCIKAHSGATAERAHTADCGAAILAILEAVKTAA